MYFKDKTLDIESCRNRRHHPWWRSKRALQAKKTLGIFMMALPLNPRQETSRVLETGVRWDTRDHTRPSFIYSLVAGRCATRVLYPWAEGTPWFV